MLPHKMLRKSHSNPTYSLFLSSLSPPSPPLFCRPRQTPASMLPAIPMLHVPPNQSPSLPPDRSFFSHARPTSHASKCTPHARLAPARHVMRAAASGQTSRRARHPANRRPQQRANPRPSQSCPPMPQSSWPASPPALDGHAAGHLCCPHCDARPADDAAAWLPPQLLPLLGRASPSSSTLLVYKKGHARPLLVRQTSPSYAINAVAQAPRRVPPSAHPLPELSS
jgi:hypothetical protein